MKRIFLNTGPLIFLLLFIFSCKSKEGRQEGTTSASFKVWGNCEMCKETIEKSITVKGVSKADWNTETKQIEVFYDSTKISLDDIQKAIAAAGYDNAAYKGDDKAYHNLPECCQYERK